VWLWLFAICVQEKQNTVNMTLTIGKPTGMVDLAAKAKTFLTELDDAKERLESRYRVVRGIAQLIMLYTLVVSGLSWFGGFDGFKIAIFVSTSVCIGATARLVLMEYFEGKIAELRRAGNLALWDVGAYGFETCWNAVDGIMTRWHDNAKHALVLEKLEREKNGNYYDREKYYTRLKKAKQEAEMYKDSLDIAEKTWGTLDNIDELVRKILLKDYTQECEILSASDKIDFVTASGVETTVKAQGVVASAYKSGRELFDMAKAVCMMYVAVTSFRSATKPHEVLAAAQHVQKWTGGIIASCYYFIDRSYLYLLGCGLGFRPFLFKSSKYLRANRALIGSGAMFAIAAFGAVKVMPKRKKSATPTITITEEPAEEVVKNGTVAEEAAPTKDEIKKLVNKAYWASVKAQKKLAKENGKPAEFVEEASLTKVLGFNQEAGRKIMLGGRAAWVYDGEDYFITKDKRGDAHVIYYGTFGRSELGMANAKYHYGDTSDVDFTAEWEEFEDKRAFRESERQEYEDDMTYKASQQNRGLEYQAEKRIIEAVKKTVMAPVPKALKSAVVVKPKGKAAPKLLVDGAVYKQESTFNRKSFNACNVVQAKVIVTGKAADGSIMESTVNALVVRNKFVFQRHVFGSFATITSVLLEAKVTLGKETDIKRQDITEVPRNDFEGKDMCWIPKESSVWTGLKDSKIAVAAQKTGVPHGLLLRLDKNHNVIVDPTSVGAPDRTESADAIRNVSKHRAPTEMGACGAAMVDVSGMVHTIIGLHWLGHQGAGDNAIYAFDAEDVATINSPLPKNSVCRSE